MPFAPQLSWSKVNLFMQCQHCFYKEQVLGKKRPSVDPDCFALNNAVDNLIKNEFDLYRIEQRAHPIMVKNNIDAIPFMHESFYTWRDYKAGGIRFRDEANGIELYGIIDDIWVNEQGELIIVDYKATASRGHMALDSNNRWNKASVRQISYYGYLLKRLGYKINATGYLLYSVASSEQRAFNKKLEFEMRVLSYTIDDSWVERTVREIKYCLTESKPPKSAMDCHLCNFN